MGNFCLEKNPVFIFLNGIIEKMGTDFQRPTDLTGWDEIVTNCIKGNIRWKQGKKKTFLTIKLVKLGQAPKDAVEHQLLEILKTWLDKAVSFLI